MSYIGKTPTPAPLTSSDISDGIIITDKLATNAVVTSKITDGTIVTADIADANVTAAKLASGTVQNQSAFKNIMINGDMSQAQRSTSVTGITGSGYNTVDRMRSSIGSAGTWTQSQSTTVPSGQGFAKSLKMDCTTANGSLSSTAALIIQTKFEGQNLQYLKKGYTDAESTTCSFWVRSAKTGTYIVNLFDTDNTRIISKSYSISQANTWEKKSVTFPGDTSGAFNNDNGDSLKLNFWLGAGSAYTSGTLATSWQSNSDANTAVGQVNLADSTSNDWYVTGIQLEAGTVASDFEYLPVDINKRRCQRYFFKNTGSGGQIGYAPSIGDNYRHELYFFPVEMRSSPTITPVFNAGSSAGSQYPGTTTVDVFVNMGNTTTIVNLTSIKGDAEL